jgi:hypothetical protein
LAASGVAVTALETRPDLPGDLAEILRLFGVVSHSRPPGFSGIAAVRITDIEAVYRLEDVTIMEPDEFLDTMLFLDSVVIAHDREEREREERRKGRHRG